MPESHQVNWPRQMWPCPFCLADYPDRPDLWDWIEVGPSSLCIPEMCGCCESDPRQWRDYDDQDH